MIKQEWEAKKAQEEKEEQEKIEELTRKQEWELAQQIQAEYDLEQTQLQSRPTRSCTIQESGSNI
jgi:hypothetical protein